MYILLEQLIIAQRHRRGPNEFQRILIRVGEEDD